MDEPVLPDEPPPKPPRSKLLIGAWVCLILVPVVTIIRIWRPVVSSFRQAGAAGTLLLFFAVLLIGSAVISWYFPPGPTSKKIARIGGLVIITIAALLLILGVIAYAQCSASRTRY